MAEQDQVCTPDVHIEIDKDQECTPHVHIVRRDVPMQPSDIMRGRLSQDVLHMNVLGCMASPQKKTQLQYSKLRIQRIMETQ